MPTIEALLLFDDHDETFSNHTIPEANTMKRITVILAIALSFMAFTPVAAQDFSKGLDAYDAYACW